MADFSLLAAPNFAQAALGGYQAGKAIGKQRRVDAALQTYSTDPDAGITALETADPALADQLQKNRDRRETRQALQKVFTPAAPVPAAAIGQDGGAVTAPPAAMPTPPMTAGPQINQSALQQLFAVDPVAASRIQDFASKANKEQQAQLVESQDALYSVAIGLKGLPYDQRKAKLQQLMPVLAQHHVTPDQVAGFDPTDENIDVQANLALGVKGVFDHQDKLADNSRADRNADRMDRRAAEQTDIARAGLGVRQGALDLARKRAAGGGGKAGGTAVDNSDLAYLMGGN